MKLFEPLTIRDVTLPNRVALSPMCMYSCENLDGMANDWHVVHLGSRASGGCGLVMTEATAVEPEGRISPQDLGIWSDDHVAPLKKVTDFIRSQGSVSAIQLAHAGRKAGTYRPWSEARGFIDEEDGGWSNKKAPSEVVFKEGNPVPHAMSVGEIRDLIQQFVRATERSNAAGFDVVELHSAHGYLMHQFLSPLSNHRTDEYGGDFAGRTRLHHELVEAVRAVWPAGKPLFMRLSVTDWVDGGWSTSDSGQLAKSLASLGVDLIDCSSGGTTPDAKIPVGPGYQVHLAEAVKVDSGLPVGAVGQITDVDQAEEILTSGQADVVFLGRELLRNPYWVQDAARAKGVDYPWPNQYAWAVGPR